VGIIWYPMVCVSYSIFCYRHDGYTSVAFNYSLHSYSSSAILADCVSSCNTDEMANLSFFEGDDRNIVSFLYKMLFLSLIILIKSDIVTFEINLKFRRIKWDY